MPAASPPPPALSMLVPAAWRPVLAQVLAADGSRELERFLEEERRAHQVLPPVEQTFAALASTPPSAVRVVVLGQDPYPTPGNANGLAFSVSPGVRVPPSLKNVFKALEAELGLPMPATGDLTPWAHRGVLLLNTVLTVRAGEAGSHRKKGWEAVTRAALTHVAARPEAVAFLALGRPAEALVTELGLQPPHRVFTAPHPSPLNGRAFVDTATSQRLFSQLNAFLQAAGRGAVDWSLAPPAR